MKKYILFAILVIAFSLVNSCKKDTEENPEIQNDNITTYNAVIDVISEVDKVFSEQIELVGKEKARESIMHLLSSNPRVAHYNFSKDSAVLFWVLTDSILCSYTIDFFDEFPDTLSFSINNNNFIKNSVVQKLLPHNNKALLLSPHYYQWKLPISPPEKDDLNYYFKKKLESNNYDVTYKYNKNRDDQNISLDDYLDWNNYGIISFVGHGAANGIYYTINSGVNYTFDLYDQYKSEFFWGQLGVNGGYYADSTLKEKIFVTSRWFKEKYDSKLDNTFILMSACESLLPSIQDGFENFLVGDNTVYWGWDESYHPRLGGFRNGRYLIDHLIEDKVNCCVANEEMELNNENWHRRLWYTPKIYLKMSANSDCEVSLIETSGEIPMADFSATPTSGTAPLNVNFTDQSQNTPTSWQWNFGDGNTSSQENPSHTYYNNGSYTVSLTVVNSDGSDTETKTNYIAVSEGGSGDLEWVNVSGGTFQMGSNSGDNDEQPIHTVTLSSYEITKYEVTNGQYCEFLNDIGCNSNGSYNGTEYINMDNSYCQINYGAGQFIPESGKSDFPVIHVNWYGSDAFAQWAGGRLPTEAEWEFAARGGNNSNGYTYSGSNAIGYVAWYDGNSGGYTHQVGAKESNELGIYDMSGNVWELCNDWYSYYSNSPQNNPQGPTSGTYHLLRGGSWYYYAYNCRITKRAGIVPSGTGGKLGFRIAR